MRDIRLLYRLMLPVARGAMLLLLVTGCPEAQAVRVPGLLEPSSTVSSAEPSRLLPLPPLREVGRGLSAHPVGRFDGILSVSEGFAYGAPERSAPAVGTSLVVTLVPVGGDGPGLQYVMKREVPGYFPEGGDWRFAVIGADGAVQAEGKLALCARCHAEAPRDHLFERLH